MFDYWKFYRHVEAHINIGHLQSFTHIPNVHKANLTEMFLNNDYMMQLILGGLRGPGIYQDCIIVKHFLPHNTWLDVT